MTITDNLTEAIEDTTEMVKSEYYNQEYIDRSTLLILQNQLLIMKTLKKVLKNQKRALNPSPSTDEAER